MTDILPVLRVLGMLIMLFAFAMGVPLAASLYAGDGIWSIYPVCMGFTLMVGATLLLTLRKYKRELQPRHGVMLVSLVWALLPLFASLPLILACQQVGRPMSFTHAYFEAVSGLNTTGATVLTGLEKLPLSINVWRCFMVLIGGMGIIVLAVAILPLLGVGGSQIFKAETPGPMKDEKLTPRIAETARGLWVVYFVVATACFFAYRVAGMGWADAFMHMCSTMGLGGFSSYDASFGQFNSPAIEGVAIFFMLMAGVNFALYFLVWKRRSLQPLLRDLEARLFVALMVGSVLLIAVFLSVHGVYPSFLESLRHAAFNVVSIATTTGYASVDYAKWPIFAPIFMLFLCAFATSAGSTGGGIKLIRSLLLLKQARAELTRIVHPRAVAPVTLRGQVVDPQVLFSILAFMLIYGGVIIVATMLLLLSGLDVISAFTAVVACINNTGPGLGQVGPANNYQGLSDFQTWVLSFAMILGRLEIFTLLVVLTPAFWRK